MNCFLNHICWAMIVVGNLMNLNNSPRQLQNSPSSSGLIEKVGRLSNRLSSKSQQFFSLSRFLHFLTKSGKMLKYVFPLKSSPSSNRNKVQKSFSCYLVLFRLLIISSNTSKRIANPFKPEVISLWRRSLRSIQQLRYIQRGSIESSRNLSINNGQRLFGHFQ